MKIWISNPLLGELAFEIESNLRVGTLEEAVASSFGLKSCMLVYGKKALQYSKSVGSYGICQNEKLRWIGRIYKAKALTPAQAEKTIKVENMEEKMVKQIEINEAEGENENENENEIRKAEGENENENEIGKEDLQEKVVETEESMSELKEMQIGFENFEIGSEETESPSVTSIEDEKETVFSTGEGNVSSEVVESPVSEMPSNEEKVILNQNQNLNFCSWISTNFFSDLPRFFLTSPKNLTIDVYRTFNSRSFVIASQKSITF